MGRTGVGQRGFTWDDLARALTWPEFFRGMSFCCLTYAATLVTSSCDGRSNLQVRSFVFE